MLTDDDVCVIPDCNAAAGEWDEAVHGEALRLVCPDHWRAMDDKMRGTLSEVWAHAKPSPAAMTSFRAGVRRAYREGGRGLG